MLKIKLVGMDKVQKMLERKRKDIERAASAAINRTAQSTRAEITRIGRSEYTMPARTLRDSVSIKKSNANTLTAEVTTQRKPIPLVEFKHKGGISTKILTAPKAAPRKRRLRVKPVQVMVRKVSGFKTLPEAFKAMGRKVGIFMRKGKERLPIQELPAVSPGGLVKSNLERISKYAHSKLLQEFRSALKSGRFTGNE